MELHLILITLSSAAWAFMSWYCYRQAPKERLNRAFAAWGLFAALWSFLILVYVAASRANFADAWYGGQQFSFLPKSVLFLNFALCLTGYRNRVSKSIIAVLFPFAAISALFGILFLVSKPVGLKAHEVLIRGGLGASPIRAAYAALTLSVYACSACVIVFWNHATKLRREKRLSSYLLVVLLIVVSANALLGLLKSRLGDFEIDALLLLQLAHAFPSVYAIDHYRTLSPLEYVIAERWRSQLSFPVIIVDSDGLVVSVNEAGTELAGSADESLIGMPYGSLLCGATIPPLDESRVGYYEVEYRIQAGESMPMSLSITPVRDKWGDLSGYALIGQLIKRLFERQMELGLSERQREVCLLLVQGLTNQEIADRLFISAGTVKNHVYNIYDKTGVKNRVELSRFLS